MEKSVYCYKEKEKLGQRPMTPGGPDMDDGNV